MLEFPESGKKTRPHARSVVAPADAEGYKTPGTAAAVLGDQGSPPAEHDLAPVQPLELPGSRRQAFPACAALAIRYVDSGQMNHSRPHGRLPDA